MTPFWHNQAPFMRDLAENGITLPAIAAQYEVSESHMKIILRNLGIRLKRPLHSGPYDKPVVGESFRAKEHMTQHKLKYTDMERVYD